MNRPVRTGVPPRVTSVTSTTPRDVVTSIRRPARDATISNVCVPCPVSTTASTRSPFMRGAYSLGAAAFPRQGGALGRLTLRRAPAYGAASR